jgi:hypothetical protein
VNRQIARNLALTSAGQEPRTNNGSRQLRAPKDSLSPGSSRISSRQLEAIAAQLTDTDKAVLLFLTEVRLVTVWQLARRLWSASTPSDARAWAARRALRRLERWRLIERLPRRIGGVRAGSSGLVFSLGPAGRRLLGQMGYQPKRLTAPGERYVRHTLAITELVVRLNEATLAGDLDLIEVETEPQCWRGFLSMMGARLVLKPDLFVRIGAGAFEDRWFFEIDLGTESVPTITNKAKRYCAYYRAGDEQERHGVFPRVVWTAPDRRRAEQIAAALEALPHAARRLFVIWPYEEVVGRLAAEAGA